MEPDLMPAAVPEGEGQRAMRRHKRPRRPFARSDRIALILGVVLAATMFAWVSLQGTRNLLEDRTVGEGRAASEMERH